MTLRMNDISPFHVMELMAKAQALEVQGHSIIHLEVGEPDFATAGPITAASQSFLSQGHVHYTAALGLSELRQAIARFYHTRYGLDLDPARVVVTCGASGALMLALGALVNPGDKWLLPDPGYPCNRNFVRLLDGIPVSLPVSASSNYQPTPQDLAQHWDTSTRGLMVASPANPTGTVLTPPQLSALWQDVSSRNGHLLVDEIYHGLSYDAELETALAISPEIFVINSFSKYFGMTGWRVGWMIVPERYLRDVEKLAQNIYICPPTISQHAALAAFIPETVSILEARRTEFGERRNLLLAGLKSIGFEIHTEPQGAFYIYADCGRFSTDSFNFAHKLLTEAGVAVTPGRDFGTHTTRTHLRFAYTTDQDRLNEAIVRLRNYLNR